MEVDTLCVHGDNPAAVELAASIKRTLVDNGTPGNVHGRVFSSSGRSRSGAWPKVSFHEPQFCISGDRMLLVAFGDTIDLRVNEKVRAMTALLRKDPPEGVAVVVPAYRSLAVVYDPLVTTPGELRTILRRLSTRLADADIPPPCTVEIPVCYGGDLGPDIAFVAEHNGLDVRDVIAIHTARTLPHLHHRVRSRVLLPGRSGPAAAYPAPGDPANRCWPRVPWESPKPRQVFIPWTVPADGV
jgi:hypothetical protein